MPSHNAGNNCIDCSTQFFFINQKSLINFLRLNSSMGYQLLVGTGMETVNSSLNTAPRLMIHCLCVAGQRGNTAQLQYARTHARACMRAHTHTHIYIYTWNKTWCPHIRMYYVLPDPGRWDGLLVGVLMESVSLSDGSLSPRSKPSTASFTTSLNSFCPCKNK